VNAAAGGVVRAFRSDDGSFTADFTYIRWLVDRKNIERWTKTWDKTILDRREPLQEWVKVCDQAVRCGVSVCACANNHYGRTRAGDGAVV